MISQKLYFKPNVLTEPLFNKWYAWSYLISPTTAAMYVANGHLKVMQSFVAAPQVHISALKNSEMSSGQFINYDKSRVNEIKALIETTKKELAHMLEFAKSVTILDNLLMNEANGYPLDSIYNKVPENLKGYIELVYDLNNVPSIRFIEGLLYNSQYYQPSFQSIALSIINQDERSFVFSTPRLEEDSSLHLNLPFTHEGLDELFKMKSTPNSFSFIKEALGVEDKDDKLFSSFFTEEIPPTIPTYDKDYVRIRYFGHACILIEFKGISILCDPLISYKYDNKIHRYTYADLPQTIDYVLITHHHHDHCFFETLLQLRHKIKNVIVPRNNGGSLADPSMKLILQNIGFKRVVEIDEIETLEIEKGKIIGLPFFGEHADLNIRTKMAYLVSFKEKSILIGADLNSPEAKLYERIHDALGNIDILFLGVQCDGAPLTWAYGSLLTRPLPRKIDQSRQSNGSNCERAMDLVNCLKPEQVYVYAMGYEPWLSYLMTVQNTEDSLPSIESKKLIEDCRSQGIIAERLFGHKEIFVK
jgi:L-ascorbate metabolism protein UlaG (beta-lactamase superfamily)